MPCRCHAMAPSWKHFTVCCLVNCVNDLGPTWQYLRPRHCWFVFVLLQLPQMCHRYQQRYMNDVPVVEEVMSSDEPRAVRPEASPDLGAKVRMHDLVHADCITDMVLAEASSKMLISSSRDGCIKAWK